MYWRKNIIVVVVVKKKFVARLFVLQGPCQCTAHIIENPKLLGSMVEEKEENSSRRLKDINSASLQHTSSWQASFEGDENFKDQDDVVEILIGCSTSELAKKPCPTSTTPSAKVSLTRAIRLFLSFHASHHCVRNNFSFFPLFFILALGCFALT